MGRFMRDEKSQLLELIEEQRLTKGSILLYADESFAQLLQDNGYTCTTQQEDPDIKAIVLTELPPDFTMAQKILGQVREISIHMLAPVFICLPNIARPEVSFHLFSGDVPKELQQPTCLPCSAKGLAGLMEKAGFMQIAAKDVLGQSALDYAQDQNVTLAAGSLVHDYMTWLKETLDDGAQIDQMVRCYLPCGLKMEHEKTERPFLTVLTRTQGKRIAELRETLLCLTAQSNINFEVLIVGHKVKDPDAEKVIELIDQLPADMRKKVRYIPLNTGNRAAPLNKGFEEARGLYVSILDDDDLVMGNWVETFADLYEKAPGAILHAYAVVQEWEIANNRWENAPRAIGTPSPNHCRDFDFALQTHMNVCPTMSLAFPVEVFQNNNIRFDEMLDTTEDWDFLMRSAFVCGVVDDQKVTSIYRLWKNSTNSYALHDQTEWDMNRAYVMRKHRNIPIVFPRGYSTRIEQLIRWQHPQEIVYTDQRAVVQAVLYADYGGYSEENSFRTQNVEQLPHFQWIYEGLANRQLSGILRFDPAEQTNLVVTNLVITMTDRSGATIEIPFKKLTSNGYLRKKQMIFLKQDPQIYIPIPQGFILDRITISGEISMELSSTTIDAVVGIPFHKRLLRKLRNLRKR